MDTVDSTARNPFSDFVSVTVNFFSLLIYTRITIYGLVKKSVMHFWMTFSLDLELNFIDKLLIFRWELIVPFLLQICFFFVMKEIS